MKYKAPSFYLNETPSLSTVTEYHQCTRNRRRIYEHLDRYHQLPVDAVISESWNQEDDKNMHYSAKVASVAEPARVDEFIRGETRIFKHRLEQMKNDHLLRFFVEEYFSRLQEEFDLVLSADEVVITLDKKGRNWIGPPKKNEAAAQELLKTINRSARSVVVVSHFSHHWQLKEAVTGGMLTSGINGIRSILCRAFEDLLRCTTSALYVSGAVERKYAVEEKAAPPVIAQLDERYLPRCMQAVLQRLQTTNHLKYHDRTNLANFLKNIGVPLDEAIRLFKRSFKCSEADFDKEHRYRIRHVYGQEGSKINYKNIPCVTIQSQTGSAGCTGCPFAKLDGPTNHCANHLSTKTNRPEEPVISPVEYYSRAKAAAPPRPNELAGGW